MPRFAANLSLLFTERPFLDRFDAAAAAGFEAVEYLFPYEVAPDAIAARLARNGLTQALFNLPPGNYGAGERGLAALPERAAELAEGVERALVYARATGTGRLHLMAGKADPASPIARAAYRDAVRRTAERLERENVTLLIEPINGRDMPGYFLDSFAAAESVIDELALPNLRLQFDVYHRQILHGDIVRSLARLLPTIGHVQIAGVPGRSEPDVGEVNYPFVFAELDRLGYGGFVGCEYRPGGVTEDGLGWFGAARG